MILKYTEILHSTFLYLKSCKWLLSRLRNNFCRYRRYQALAEHLKPFFNKKNVKVKGRQCPDYSQSFHIVIFVKFIVGFFLSFFCRMNGKRKIMLISQEKSYCLFYQKLKRYLFEQLTPTEPESHRMYISYFSDYKSGPSSQVF